MEYYSVHGRRDTGIQGWFDQLGPLGHRGQIGQSGVSGQADNSGQPGDIGQSQGQFRSAGPTQLSYHPFDWRSETCKKGFSSILKLRR